MGLFDGLLGGGAGSADDPYADILTPAQRNQMQVQGLLAMAGAFAQAGMPSRLPVPFGSALGSAAAALGTGQEAGMKTAIENALAAQKVRDLRNTAEFRKKLLGDIDPTSPLGRAIAAITTPPGGTAPTPGPTPAGPGGGGGGGGGGGAPAGGGGGLLSPDLSLGSDTTPDYFTRGLAPKAPGGLLDYPSDQGTMRAGGGLVPERPDAGIGTATPSSAYAPGGSLYPFRDLGVVPGTGGGAPSKVAPGGDIRTNSIGEQYNRDGELIAPGVAGPVPPVTSVPGGTNGIDPRKRAALDAILAGMQTAQGGPSAQRLPQFAGPGAADAATAQGHPELWNSAQGGASARADEIIRQRNLLNAAAPTPTAPDTVPEGGGLLGVAPDLRAPIEDNPFAPRPSPGDPRGVAPLIRQAMLRQGVDPNVALRVAQSEGLGTFLGDQGKSGGAFQLYTGGGLGNEFQKQTGLDPLDPKNEAATIDWVAKNVNRTGWSPYHGAAKVGVGPRTGLPGGDLPPDELIPSGSGAGGNPPTATLAQYAPGGGGAPGAAPVPGATGGPPLYPSAAPNQAAGVSQLIVELARRNAAAEVLGLGNPYGSLLTVLQGSPQYKAQVEAATEFAKRTAGLPFIKEEKRLGAEGELPSLISRDVNKGVIDQLNKQIEQMGAAALNPAGTLPINTPNGPVEKPVTQLQSAVARAGFDVPEIGFKGMRGPLPAGQIPGLPGVALPGAPAGPGATGAPGPGPQAQGVTPGGPGTLYDKPYQSPSDIKSSELGVTAGWKALQDTHAAEIAANRSDQQLGQIAEAMRGFTPGKTAEWRLTWGQYLKDAGFKIDGVSDGEIMQQAQRRLQLAAANVHEGSVSNFERGIYGETVTQLTNTPEGIVKAIGIQQRLNDYDRKVAQIHRDTIVNGVPNLVDAQSRIAKLGPPLSPGELSALQEIRAGQVPGKGQAATAPAPPDQHPLMRQQAADAIAKGAPRAGVIKRLQDMGVNTEGL